MDAVRTTSLDQTGAVVEDEERAVLRTSRPERLGCGDQRLVAECLLAQLDDVDTSA